MTYEKTKTAFRIIPRQCGGEITIPKSILEAGSPGIFNTYFLPIFSGGNLIFQSGTQPELSEYKKAVEIFGTKRECDEQYKKDTKKK